jgi:kinesin family protein 2/24
VKQFTKLIEKARFPANLHLLKPHISPLKKLSVLVRKRPLVVNQNKAANSEVDSISCASPRIKVHFPKTKVDGITKYIEDYTFTFDESFNQNESTQEVYIGGLQRSVKGLMSTTNDLGSDCTVASVDVVTVFAYG